MKPFRMAVVASVACLSPSTIGGNVFVVAAAGGGDFTALQPWRALHVRTRRSR